MIDYFEDNLNVLIKEQEFKDKWVKKIKHENPKKVIANLLKTFPCANCSSFGKCVNNKFYKCSHEEYYLWYLRIVGALSLANGDKKP